MKDLSKMTQKQLLDKISRQKRVIAKLGEAMKREKKRKRLALFLPVCSNCKKIRDDQKTWHEIVEYITIHSETKFTHTICPDCVRKLYPELCKD